MTENNVFVIFICGLGGTKLYKGLDVMWPPDNYKILDYCLDTKIKKIFKKFNKKKITSNETSSVFNNYLELLIDKNLVTGSSTDNYEDIIEFIKKSTNGNYYIFNYDWRLSFEASIKKLADEIENLDIKNKEINIWSHSAGGVIAFDYLNNYYNCLKGPVPYNFQQIKKYVSIGCPIKGSIQALTSVLSLNSSLLISNIELNQAIVQGNIQSVYELIPNNIYNLFYCHKTKVLLSVEEVYELLITKGFNENQLIKAMEYRKNFKEFKQNPNIDFTFIVGSYPHASICTSFLVNKETKEITCEYSYGCSDGTVLMSEAVPDDIYTYKTKYVLGKHNYLTSCDEVFNILEEELFYETKRNYNIIGSLVNRENPNLGKLEFSLIYENEGKKYPIKKLTASHINFANKTVSQDVTALFEYDKNNNLFFFKSPYKYGTLQFRDLVIYYKSERDTLETPIRSIKEENANKKDEYNKKIIKELYVDLNNYIINSLI